MDSKMVLIYVFAAVFAILIVSGPRLLALLPERFLKGKPKDS
jgi:hypothetical protein